MPYSAHSLSTPQLASLASEDQSPALPQEDLPPAQTPGNRLPFNLRTVVTPHVLVLSKTPKAISESIAWANRHAVPLCGRSGGHSYEGFSSLAGLVIDVGQINSIAVDTANQTATIGAGCRLEAILGSRPNFRSESSRSTRSSSSRFDGNRHHSIAELHRSRQALRR